MNKKAIAVGLALILVAAFIIVFLMPTQNPNYLVIQFYDSNKEPVGRPLKVTPLAPVSVEGVEVTYFTITVNWFTDDPDALRIHWVINVKVYRTSPTYPYESVAFDDLCWEYFEDCKAFNAKTSGFYAISEYAETGIPENTDFFMKFYGNYEFTGSATSQVIFSGSFDAVTLACHHGSYTYEAYLEVNT